MRTRITHSLTNVILTLLLICLVAADGKTKAKKESLKHLKRLGESKLDKSASTKASEPKQRQLDLSQPKSSDELNQAFWNQPQLGLYPNYYQSQLPVLNYYSQPSGLIQTHHSINPYNIPINPSYYYSPLLPNFHNLPNITSLSPNEGTTPSDVEIVTPHPNLPDNNLTYPNIYDIFRNTPLGPLFPQSPISPQTPYLPNPIHPINPIFKQDPTSTQKPISPENPISPQTPTNTPLFPFFHQYPLYQQTPFLQNPIVPNVDLNPFYKQNPTSTQKPDSKENPTSPQTTTNSPLFPFFPQNPLFQQSPYLPNPLFPNLDLSPKNPTSTEKPNSPNSNIPPHTPIQPQYSFFPINPIFRLNPNLPQYPTETSTSTDKSSTPSPNLPNPTSPIPPIYSGNSVFRQNPLFTQYPIYASTHGAPSIFQGPFSQPISPNPYSYEYYHNNIGQAYGLPGFRPFFYDGFYKNVNETKCLNVTGPCDPFDYPTLKSNTPTPKDKSKIIEVINRLYKQDPNIVIFNTKEPPLQRQFDDIPEDIKDEDIRIGKDSGKAETQPFYQAYKDIMHINKSVLSTFAPYFYKK